MLRTTVGYRSPVHSRVLGGRTLIENGSVRRGVGPGRGVPGSQSVLMTVPVALDESMAMLKLVPRPRGWSKVTVTGSDQRNFRVKLRISASRLAQVRCLPLVAIGWSSLVAVSSSTQANPSSWRVKINRALYRRPGDAFHGETYLH